MPSELTLLAIPGECGSYGLRVASEVWQVTRPSLRKVIDHRSLFSQFPFSPRSAAIAFC